MAVLFSILLTNFKNSAKNLLMWKIVLGVSASKPLKHCIAAGLFGGYHPRINAVFYRYCDQNNKRIPQFNACYIRVITVLEVF